MKTSPNLFSLSINNRLSSKNHEPTSTPACVLELGKKTVHPVMDTRKSDDTREKHGEPQKQSDDTIEKQGVPQKQHDEAKRKEVAFPKDVAAVIEPK
jgi:hypothetical protein